MVLRRKQERKEEKEKVRRALMRATLRLASTYGFSSLSLREVAREAGIAPTSFYRHFEDMEQLGLALVEENVGPLLDALTRPCRASAKRPFEVPGQLVHGLFSWLDEDPELVRFMLAERAGSLKTSRVAVRARVDAFIDQVRELMRSASGDPAPRFVVEAIVVLAFEAVLKAIDGSDEHRRTAQQDVQKQLETLAAGIVANRQPWP